MAWVYKQTGPLPVLACEGSHGKFPSVVRELLKSEGVPDELIWIEDRSHNTHENAEYGAVILRQHGIHRGACYRRPEHAPGGQLVSLSKESVLPAPSEFVQLDLTSDDLLPSWKAIRRNEITLHEAVGLLACLERVDLIWGPKGGEIALMDGFLGLVPYNQS